MGNTVQQSPFTTESKPDFPNLTSVFQNLLSYEQTQPLTSSSSVTVPVDDRHSESDCEEEDNGNNITDHDDQHHNGYHPHKEHPFQNNGHYHPVQLEQDKTTTSHEMSHLEGPVWDKGDDILRHQLTNSHFRQISRSQSIRHYKNRSILDVYSIDPVVLYQDEDGYISRCVNLTTGQVFGVKTIIKGDELWMESARTEEKIRKFVDHPNIAKLFDTFEDTSHIHWVIELCQGPDLIDLIVQRGRLSETEACFLMRDIFSAVAYLHSNGIISREIHPENFRFRTLDNTLKEPHLKLVNLRLARYARRSTIFKTRAGTPYCLAPEVVKGVYTRRCDDWSCGIILFILLFGCPPVFGDTDIEVLQNIRLGRMLRPKKIWDAISREGRQLIQALLNVDVTKRGTCREALTGNWIQKHIQERLNPDLSLFIVKNMQAFAAASRFKQAALIILAQFLPDEMIHDLQRAFRILDVDCHNIIYGLERYDNCYLPSKLKRDLWKLDLNGNEMIDYTASMDPRRYVTRQKGLLRYVFQYFDIDNDGVITLDELQYATGVAKGDAHKTGLVLAWEMIQDVDIDGDGQIDFDEFVLMLNESSISKDSMITPKGGQVWSPLCMEYLKNRQTLLKRTQLLDKWVQFACHQKQLISRKVVKKDQEAQIRAREAVDRLKALKSQTAQMIRADNKMRAMIKDHNSETTRLVQRQFVKWQIEQDRLRHSAATLKREKGRKQVKWKSDIFLS